MEPMDATVRHTPGGLTVWGPTQAGPMFLAAEAVGPAPGQVVTHTTLLGGGFGRRFEIDTPIRAAPVSEAVGSPGKVLWSREDDTRHDFHRPGAVARMRTALDAEGRPVAFRADIASPSILERSVPALVVGDVDRTSVDGIAAGVAPSGVPTGPQHGFDAAKVACSMRNTSVPGARSRRARTDGPWRAS